MRSAPNMMIQCGKRQPAPRHRRRGAGSVRAVNRRSAVGDGLADRDVAAALGIAFFTSPMVSVMRISRRPVSVQLKIMRQRHTPPRSFRTSSRSSAASIEQVGERVPSGNASLCSH